MVFSKQNVIAILNGKDFLFNSQLLKKGKFYFLGDIEDCIRAVLVAEAEEGLVYCFCEHSANVYAAKIERNEIIII